MTPSRGTPVPNIDSAIPLNILFVFPVNLADLAEPEIRCTLIQISDPTKNIDVNFRSNDKS